MKATEQSRIRSRTKRSKITRVKAIALAVAAAWGAYRPGIEQALGQFNYTGGTYGQNFDALPTSNSGSPTYADGSSGTIYAVPGQADRSGALTGSYTQLSGWYLASVSGTPRFTVDDTGSNGTSSIYSYGFSGVNSTSDRALGIGGTSGPTPYIG